MMERGPTALAGAHHYVPRRVCPLCDALVSVTICPNDGTATLSLDAPSSNPDRLEAGRLIADRYRIEAVIGSGGFAKVFRAVHTGTGQNVALKVLGGGGLEDTAALRRFFREARASAGLRHPNTVRVFDFGQEDDGTVYLAMELLTGLTLKQLQQRRLLDNSWITELEALEIAIAVTQSLAEAHSTGLIHRDVSPNNVFLHDVAGSSPVVKLLDFGLVKDGGLKPLTRIDQVFGTVSYMSPEQVSGRTVTPRSDLYSLGITLWWMLAGRTPFQGDSHREVMDSHLHLPMPPLSLHARSMVSPEVERIIEKATAKDPNARFVDAQAFRAELQQCFDLLKERARKGPAAMTGPTVEIETRSMAMLEVSTLLPEATMAESMPAQPLPPSVRPRWGIAGVAAFLLIAALLMAGSLSAKDPAPALPKPAPPPVVEVQLVPPAQIHEAPVEETPRPRMRKKARVRRPPRIERIEQPPQPPPEPALPSILKEKI
jgi:eukaryotic-like serine/threonine-protein kinase